MSGTAEEVHPGSGPHHAAAARARAGAALLRPVVLLAGAVVLLYAVLCVCVLSGSPLVAFDTAALRWAESAYEPHLHRFLWEWVVLGQRAVCLGLAAAWLTLRALRTRDLRPLLTLGLATLLLNVSVGLVKTAIGRLGPLQLGASALHPGASTIFSDGTIFPSGHTANAVVTWGLLAWLARDHRRLWGVASGLLAASVGLTTIYLGTHWVSDVLAGWAAGGLVLLAVPALATLADRLARALAAVPAWWRRPRPGAALPQAARMRS